MKSPFSLSLFVIMLTMFALPGSLFAQLSTGGVPLSFSLSLPPDTGNFIFVQHPSMDAVQQEDQQTPLPYRFAVNLPVNLGIGTAGQWRKVNGATNVWRLNIKSPGARALILYFDKFKLPEGGRFFVYNPKRTQLLGAFTALNNNNLSTFATGLITGDELTVEYDAPAELPMPDLRISEVGHAYRGISDFPAGNSGFGGSGPCEVNINCAEGTIWQKQKRSVTRITVKRGSSSVWCTGSLVNTVRNDGTPYVLTADHCGYLSSDLDLSQWIFYFNYEGAGCNDPTTEPPLKSVTGATLVAHGGNAASTGSDFFLVLLKSNIPDSYNVYYNGWSRETMPPSPSGFSIHHPQGDIKKISTYTSPLQQSHWVGNPALSHWMVTWAGTLNGHGTTEGGSSGSPLFDNQGRLVGTLTGGDSSCDSASLNLPDYYGMFSYHWNQNGTDSINILKCWLDPDNTGVMSLNGWGLPVQEPVLNEWVTIYPNPATDQLNVKFYGIESETVHLAMYDIWGKPCFTRNFTSGPGMDVPVDLSGFAPGMYLLNLSDGHRQILRKIVKQ